MISTIVKRLCLLQFLQSSPKSGKYHLGFDIVSKEIYTYYFHQLVFLASSVLSISKKSLQF